MSSFVSAAGTRLTARRLVGALAACAAVAVVVGAIAPLIGTDTARGVWRHTLLPLAAYWGDGPDHVVLWVRLTRVLACLLVGAALAGAGCALQALLRNPLAEPFTLGISSGASLAAVVAIRLGAERWLGYGAIGVASLVGAALALAFVWQLGRIGRQLPPATLILAGVTVSLFSSSASVLIQTTSDFADVSHMLVWMVGGLDAVQLAAVKIAAPAVGVGLAVLLVHARELNALAAGPESAASVGVAVARTQTIVFVVASLLVGVAISLVGPIGFIGLVVPHALRGLLGPDHRLLLPASMLIGAAVLVGCDTVARAAIPLERLPTGAVTAVLGIPFFLAILLRQKTRAAMWGRA
jgi:ABC-type Fe3+-siderophore transport system permease subunit